MSSPLVPSELLLGLLAAHESVHVQAVADARSKVEALVTQGVLNGPELDAARTEWAKLKQSSSVGGLCAQIIEARRERDHQARKSLRPEGPISLESLRSHFRRPADPAELEDMHQGLDQHLLTFQACLDANDLDDAIWEAVEICRKQFFAVFHATGVPIDPPK